MASIPSPAAALFCRASKTGMRTKKCPIRRRKRKQRPLCPAGQPEIPVVVGRQIIEIAAASAQKNGNPRDKYTPGEYHEKRRPYDDGGCGAGVDSDFTGPAYTRDFRLFRSAAFASHVQANVEALKSPLDRYPSHGCRAEPAPLVWLNMPVFRQRVAGRCSHRAAHSELGVLRGKGPPSIKRAARIALSGSVWVRGGNLDRLL